MKQGIFDKHELPGDTIHDIVKLLYLIWPYKEGEMNIERALDEYIKDESLTINKSILIWENNLLVGHTEIFSREIESNQRKIDNMALAGVCVRPGFRGKNYGIELVKTAFDLFDSREFECSVFQTNVPDFYKKFGCRTITNKFSNSLNPENPRENPWRNEYVMIYPGDYDIGPEYVDLKGNGY
jgi:predicted GNAT family N-acyltransferase